MWMKLPPLLPCIMRSLGKTQLIPLLGLEGWGAGGWEGACCGRFHKQHEAVSWLTSLDACGWRPCGAAVEISDKWGERKRERESACQVDFGGCNIRVHSSMQAHQWPDNMHSRQGMWKPPARDVQQHNLGHRGPLKRDLLWALCITVSDGWSDMEIDNYRNNGAASHFLIGL